MHNLNLTESELQERILSGLEQNGWQVTRKGEDHSGYDKKRALWVPDLFAWLESESALSSNPEQSPLNQLKHNYPDKWQEQILNWLDQWLWARGPVYVLKNRFSELSPDNANSSSTYSFSAALPHTFNKLNPTYLERYNNNILRVVEEVVYSDHHQNRIDLVFFINGIAVATAELKVEGQQSLAAGEQQYRQNRLPEGEALLTFNRGAIVHFVITDNQIKMTTKLAGDKTKFLPFNPSKEDVFGNPIIPDAHDFAVKYFWEYIGQKDNWLKIFIDMVYTKHASEKDSKAYHLSGKTSTSYSASTFLTGDHKKAQAQARAQVRSAGRGGAPLKAGDVEAIIFPRFHQFDAVEKAIRDVEFHKNDKDYPSRYLFQHSAGSGKTATMVWLATNLLKLQDDNHQRIYDKVILITHRKILEGQLNGSLHQQIADGTMDFRTIVVDFTDSDKSKSAKLAEVLQDNTAKIINVTQQTFGVEKNFTNISQANMDKSFAIIIDEAHNSQHGSAANEVVEVLNRFTIAKEEQLAKLGSPENLSEEQKALLDRAQSTKLSYFVFTATPKPETLEKFGTRSLEVSGSEEFVNATTATNSATSQNFSTSASTTVSTSPANSALGAEAKALVGGIPAAQMKNHVFHLYSMQQAIDEGFILDVLTNFKHINTEATIRNLAHRDELTKKRKAYRDASEWRDRHPSVISDKVDYIVKHFIEEIKDKLSGKSKAMIITPDKITAVRYKLFLDALLNSEEYKKHGFKSLINISGEVLVNNSNNSNNGLVHEDDKFFNNSTAVVAEHHEIDKKIQEAQERDAELTKQAGVKQAEAKQAEVTAQTEDALATEANKSAEDATAQDDQVPEIHDGIKFQDLLEDDGVSDEELVNLYTHEHISGNPVLNFVESISEGVGVGNSYINRYGNDDNTYHYNLAEDKDIKALFSSNDDYRFLIVVDKFTTGFDEPKLCALYVDKTISSDVERVQTYSRLNRTYPGNDRKETFIVDFRNKEEDVLRSFKLYNKHAKFDRKLLNNQISKIFDLQNQIYQFTIDGKQVITPELVKEFKELCKTNISSENEDESDSVQSYFNQKLEESNKLRASRESKEEIKTSRDVYAPTIEQNKKLVEAYQEDKGQQSQTQQSQVQQEQQQQDQVHQVESSVNLTDLNDLIKDTTVLGGESTSTSVVAMASGVTSTQLTPEVELVTDVGLVVEPNVETPVGVNNTVAASVSSSTPVTPAPTTVTPVTEPVAEPVTEPVTQLGSQPSTAASRRFPVHQVYGWRRASSMVKPESSGLTVEKPATPVASTQPLSSSSSLETAPASETTLASATTSTTPVSATASATGVKINPEVDFVEEQLVETHAVSVELNSDLTPTQLSTDNSASSSTQDTPKASSSSSSSQSSALTSSESSPAKKPNLESMEDSIQRFLLKDVGQRPSWTKLRDLKVRIANFISSIAAKYNEEQVHMVEVVNKKIDQLNDRVKNGEIDKDSAKADMESYPEYIRVNELEKFRNSLKRFAKKYELAFSDDVVADYLVNGNPDEVSGEENATEAKARDHRLNMMENLYWFKNLTKFLFKRLEQLQTKDGALLKLQLRRFNIFEGEVRNPSAEDQLEEQTLESINAGDESEEEVYDDSPEGMIQRARDKLRQEYAFVSEIIASIGFLNSYLTEKNKEFDPNSFFVDLTDALLELKGTLGNSTPDHNISWIRQAVENESKNLFNPLQQKVHYDTWFTRDRIANLYASMNQEGNFDEFLKSYAEFKEVYNQAQQLKQEQATQVD